MCISGRIPVQSGYIWYVQYVIWLRVYDGGTTDSPRNAVVAKVTLVGFCMTRFHLIAQRYCEYIQIRSNNALTTVDKIINRSTTAS